MLRDVPDFISLLCLGAQRKGMVISMKNNQAEKTAQRVVPLIDPVAEAEKKSRRITLGFCFGIPFILMLIMHICVRVWPFGTNSVLVLDLNAQYVYYFEKLREILVGGDSILYAFDRNLGGEFMGMFAYYLSSPFSLLVALFPKTMITEALLVIFLLKTGFCGLTFGYFLTKMRKMAPSLTAAFSTMYALCAYAVVMQHNLMWIDNLIALPLLVVGIEALIKEGKYRMYVLSLVYCVMSNFYIGYMSCVFVFIYFFVRYFMLSPEERNPGRKSMHFTSTLVRMGIFSAIALAISMVIIYPTYYSLSFGKFAFSDPKYEAKQLFDFLDLLTKIFFGSYDTVQPSGMPFIYCGMLMPILMPLYFFNPHFSRRKKIGFGLLLVIFIVSFNFSLADIFWHGMQKPNWLNARFAFLFVFIVLWMAADALAHLRELGAKKASLCAAVWAVILIFLQKMEYENLPDFFAVWASLLFLVIYAVLLPLVCGKKEQILSVALTTVICTEMLLNGVASLYALDKDVIISTRNSYREMIDEYTAAIDTIEDDTFYRAEKLVHRKKNDNMALGLNGLTSSTSTLNAKVVDLLGQFGFASKSHWTMYAGATSVSDALFGIKYVIADESAKKPVMDYIHRLYELETSTEDHLDVYRNPYALSIAYEVDGGILDYDLPPRVDPNKPDQVIDEEYAEPFRYMNEVLSAMLDREVSVFTEVDTDGPEMNGLKLLNVVGHKGYEVTGSSGSLTWTLNIESEKPVYLYFPSEYPRETKLKVNGKDMGKYMKDETHSILELGSFEVGDTVEIKLTPTGKNLYLTKDTHFFWYYDEEAFLEAAEALSHGNLAAYSKKDDKITGKITVAEEDSVIFTTIPYDEGWKAYVDGKRVEITSVLNGSLLAFDCPTGTHDIRLVYRPKAVTTGLTVTLIGLAAFGLIVNMDYGWTRKRGKWVRVTKK